MKCTLVLMCLIWAGNAAAADCDSIPGADSLLRPGVVVLLGEIHGTNEGPASVANLVCGALAKGLHVTVALELLAEDQERIEKYLSSDGEMRDRDSLIAGEFWQRDYQDGRASQAMVGLIETLRLHRMDTTTVLNVLALDNPDALEGRDRFMADRLLSATSVNTSGFVVSLTGNIHSRRIIGTHFDPAYEPMGYHVWLRSPEREVVAIDIVYEGGTAWVCTSESGCGVLELSGGKGEPGIQFNDAGAEEAYQGWLNVGRISASLPARDL